MQAAWHAPWCLSSSTGNGVRELHFKYSTFMCDLRDHNVWDEREGGFKIWNPFKIVSPSIFLHCHMAPEIFHINKLHIIWKTVKSFTTGSQHQFKSVRTLKIDLSWLSFCWKIPGRLQHDFVSLQKQRIHSKM